MTGVLAIDLGKTGCRAVLFTDGVRGAQVRGPGAIGLADTGGAVRAMDAINAATRGWATVDAVSAGLAGMGKAREQAPALAAALADRFGTEQIVLTDDMTTSHAGALGGAPGAVLAAGTGAIALAVTDAGVSHYVDGWGYLLGDDGSGFAVGRAGLRSALCAHDGRGGSAELHARATARFGNLDGLPWVVHGVDNPPRLIAAFARDVADAAHAGDPVARGIWADAGRALARTAAAALSGGSVTTAFVCTGGLMQVGDLLTGPLDAQLARLAPGVRRRAPLGDALDGAHLLLTRPDLPHRTQLRRSSTKEYR